MAPSATRHVREPIRGALAQLGERGLCKPEVRGSIPLSSTIEIKAGTPCTCLFFY